MIIHVCHGLKRWGVIFWRTYCMNDLRYFLRRKQASDRVITRFSYEYARRDRTVVIVVSSVEFNNKPRSYSGTGPEPNLSTRSSLGLHAVRRPGWRAPTTAVRGSTCFANLGSVEVIASTAGDDRTMTSCFKLALVFALLVGKGKGSRQFPSILFYRSGSYTSRSPIIEHCP
jgi:hypothetical protein